MRKGGRRSRARSRSGREGGGRRKRKKEEEQEEERMIIQPHQRQLQRKGWDSHVIVAAPRVNDK